MADEGLNVRWTFENFVDIYHVEPAVLTDFISELDVDSLENLFIDCEYVGLCVNSIHLFFCNLLISEVKFLNVEIPCEGISLSVCNPKNIVVCLIPSKDQKTCFFDFVFHKSDLEHVLEQDL